MLRSRVRVSNCGAPSARRPRAYRKPLARRSTWPGSALQLCSTRRCMVVFFLREEGQGDRKEQKAWATLCFPSLSTTPVCSQSWMTYTSRPRVHHATPHGPFCHDRPGLRPSLAVGQPRAGGACRDFMTCGWLYRNPYKPLRRENSFCCGLCAPVLCLPFCTEALCRD